MPFNGSGVFVRGFSWVNDATNNIPITATRMDSDTNDIVTNGLGLCLTRDGQGSATSNLPMNGFKHTGCAPGVAATDYVTMTQIGSFANLNSPAFTGTPTAPTAVAGSFNTQIANTFFVTNALGSYLPLSGGTLTGPLNGSGQSSAISSAMPAAGMATSTGGIAAFIVRSDAAGSGAAYLGFNRSGQFAAYFGIDQDNFLKVGGWSFGNVAYRIQHEGVSGLTLQSPQVTGTMAYGGNAQPHIFVQSGTPTALAVGDLWFF